MNLNKLFNPKSIAVVGASSQEGKVGNILAKNLTELGYAGEVYFINPKYSEIFGRQCHKKLSELEHDVDLAIMAIPAESAVLEIKENCDRIKNYVVISAGFSEIGGAGKKREEELVRLVSDKNINILGPNCLGFIIPSLNLNASFSGGLPCRGNISFVSQSGALAAAIMDQASLAGLKFSNIISIGNKAQIDESAMLEFLARDVNTKVIGMYLEGIKDGKKFIQAAEFFSKIKPMVVLKSGRGEKSQQAISSHTGALAGSDNIVSAAFKKAGIIRAENLEEFVNLLSLISQFDSSPDEKATLITNAGGLGVLSADAFNEKSIALFELDENLKKELNEFLPKESSVDNPIDLLGDADEIRYEKTLEVLAQSEGSGTLICLLTPQDQTPVIKIAEKIIAAKNKSGKNIITIFSGGERVKDAIKKIRANGIPNFSYPDLAVSALGKFYEWSRYSMIINNKAANSINKKRQESVQKIIKEAKKEGRILLYSSESKGILEQYGLCVADFLEINPKDKISIFNLKGNKSGIVFPVVLKVDSDKFVHKTEKAGIILDIKNESELDAALLKIRSNFKNTRLIIQAMAKPGSELIIGIKKDKIFGPIIVCGLGGIYTEIFKMADNWVPPLTLSEIEAELASGKIGFMFKKTRGKKSYNIFELSQVLLGVSLMASEIPEIKGFDINPMVVYNDGEPAKILDVKIFI